MGTALQRRTLAALRLTLAATAISVLVPTIAGAQAPTGSGSIGGGQVGSGIQLAPDVGAGTGSNTGGSNAGGSNAGGSNAGGPVPDCTGYDDMGTAHTGPPSYSAVNGAIADEMDRRAQAGISTDIIGSSRPQRDPANPETGFAPGTWYRQDCGGYPAGYLWAPQGSTPAAVAPPPPPTADEVRRLVPYPTPALALIAAEGRTGIATWTWDDRPPAPTTATVSIRGYTATATATATQWRWDMAATGPSSTRNPTSVLTSDNPGTRWVPAARYIYETKGTYTVDLTVAWDGSFTFTGPTSSAGPLPLGTDSRTASQSYIVTEARPVIVGGS